jgi:hypothetical protein
MKEMNEKLVKAIVYLRERKKYIIDPGCRFRPTSATHTDIAKTIEAYRQEVLEEPAVRLIKGKKK